jgi:predicted  nucleic acid-binding Zn-ribbon protein
MANSYQESIDKAKKDINEIKSSLVKLHEEVKILEETNRAKRKENGK